jgi:hypothetical protein
MFWPVCYITAEEARHTGVVCKNWHVEQPEVGINISGPFKGFSLVLKDEVK